AAQADLQALQAGDVGTLRVGTFQSAGARLLPAVMRRFSSAWPGIDVEIGAERLIGFKAHRSSDSIEGVLRAAGVEPRYAFRTNDNGTVQGLVAAGIGNAIQPRLTVDVGDPRIVVRDL